MTARELAYANPDVLRWARESSGYSLETAAEKIGIRLFRLQMAEEGVDYLTLRQAEKAADVYERSLAALLVPTPPDEPPEEAQFRSLAGAPSLPWPPEMRLLARRVRRRQDAAAELYEDLEEVPPWVDTMKRLERVTAPELPAAVRELLGVTSVQQEEWARGDDWAPLRGWVDAVESLGVLVMQDSSVKVDLMRGFASADDDVPAIVLNSKDHPRARAFTVLHELGHLLLGLAGHTSERLANDFAGEVVMPFAWLQDELASAAGSTLLAQVDQVARTFGVTPLAAAVRVRRAGLAAPAAVEAAIAAIRARHPATEADGSGHYYYRTIATFGPAFIRLVLSALDNQTVTYPTASTLLDNVRINNFDTLRDFVARRGRGA